MNISIQGIDIIQQNKTIIFFLYIAMGQITALLIFFVYIIGKYFIGTLIRKEWRK